MKESKKFTVSLPALIIAGIILIILLVGGGAIYFNKVSDLKLDNLEQSKLIKSLNDTVTYYVNENNEITAQKLTLQASIKDLDAINTSLSKTQQELLKRIKRIEKEKAIIAAALIETNVIIDSLISSSVNIDTLNNTLTFTDSTKDISYKFIVRHVRAISELTDPVLEFNKFTLPNTQFVEFHWGQKKEGYPVSFSVSNSNKYFNTVNIESYAIPELNKVELNPNGWQKFTKFFKKSSNSIITLGVGAGIGVATTLILLK